MLKENMQKVALISGSLSLYKGSRTMANNDKLYDCADSYSQFENYEYRLTLFNNGQIVNATVNLDTSNFMHLAGLEKLTDLPMFSNTNSNRLYDNILQGNVTFPYACSSSLWNVPLNNPQQNGVTYTIEDRIETLTNLRNILSSSNIKAYSWKPDCHRSLRPYSSEISAHYMLAIDNANKKTPDERLYIFLKSDKYNPQISYGVSQFPTDQTYNDDGHISVPEIRIMSLIEHDKVRNADRHIVTISADERRALIESAFNQAQYTTIKGDLKQLKSKRQKYVESGTEAAQRAYEQKLKFINRRNVYTPEMLEDVIDRLMSQAQDPHNNNVQDLILKEIKLVKQELSDREKGHNNQVSTNVTLSVNTHNNDGSMSVKPIMTVEIPNALTKVKAKLKWATHLISVSISNVFLDIKTAFTTSGAKQNKNIPKKTINRRHTLRSETDTAQTAKPDISGKERQSEKEEPMFSISKIKSDKYASTSSKDKNAVRTKNNDLDL